MNIKQNAIYLYSFILGLFGFSILGQYIQLNVLKFPYYLVEIYFIPAILMNLSSTSGYFNRIRLSTALLMLLVLMSMFSNIINTGEIFSSIIAYRAILYLIFFVSYFRKKQNEIPLNLVLLISFGAVCGELIYVLFVSTSLVSSSINCLAIAILIWVLYMKKKYLFTMVSIIATLFLVINTGYRIGFFVIALTIMSIFVYTLVNSNHYKSIGQRFKAVLFFVVGFFGVLYFIINLNRIVERIAALTGMSDFAVFRVTTRLESLLSLDISTSQDTGRLEMFNVLQDRIWFIIPRGLFGFVEGGIEYAYYIDVPVTYLLDIFGSAVTLVIVFYFILKFIQQAKTKKIDKQMRSMSIWLIPLLGMLLITNGTFIANTSQAIIVGTILGYATKKEVYMKKESESKILV